MKNGIVISAILLQFVAASSFAQINLSSMDVASSPDFITFLRHHIAQIENQ